MEIGSRRMLHCNVTAQPTADFRAEPHAWAWVPNVRDCHLPGKERRESKFRPWTDWQIDSGFAKHH